MKLRIDAAVALDKENYLSRADVCDAATVYRKAENGLQRFIDAYPKSERVAEARKLIAQLGAARTDLEAICKLTKDFDLALKSHDLKTAAELLRKMPGKLAPESVGGHTQELEDARSPSVDVAIREFSATPTKYLRKKIRIGPLVVARNEVSEQTLRACEADPDSILDTETCASMSATPRYWDAPDDGVTSRRPMV